MPLWPGPVRTDAEGRFTLRGLNRGHFGVGLRSSATTGSPPTCRRSGEGPDGNSAAEPLIGGRPEVAALKGGRVIEFTMALAPARVLEGRVTFADTGRPVPAALVKLSGAAQRTRTDVGGRFRFIIAVDRPDWRQELVALLPRGCPTWGRPGPGLAGRADAAGSRVSPLGRRAAAAASSRPMARPR